MDNFNYCQPNTLTKVLKVIRNGTKKCLKEKVLVLHGTLWYSKYSTISPAKIFSRHLRKSRRKHKNHKTTNWY